MPLVRHRALAVAAGIRRGSSLPVVVRTGAGNFLTKLRGAAQGLAPLVAEIIVGELATRLGLPVPERVLVDLDEDVPSEDRNDELADLLASSRGTNLGFRYLEGATDLLARDAGQVPAEIAANVLWLDGLVMNPDRTPRNPNVMMWHRQPWLIDHGAALSFHYDLERLDEQTARAFPFDGGAHLFARHAPALRAIDAANARCLTRTVLEAAVAMVPEEFLVAAFPRFSPGTLRDIYVAVLWKRLKAPRPFVPA
jgi:hypothetical protein